VARTASIGEARRRLPRDFIASLDASFPQAVVETILRGMASARPTTLRANTLRFDATELLRFFRDNAVKARRIPWYPDAFSLTEAREREVEQWSIYQEGRVYLQSISSMIPALALAPCPGERVLDIAAAPGSKTTQMAALMDNTGCIVANELDPVRAERLAYNVQLQGCTNVELVVGRGEKIGERQPDSFDRVLLDVPCSGEGRFVVFEPATSRSWSRTTVSECVRIQRKLLASGVRALKPGGVLVYSTCTLNKEENERAVQWALQNLPVDVEKLPLALPGAYAGMSSGGDPRVAGAVRIFPDPLREGFFICRMRKRT